MIVLPTKVAPAPRIAETAGAVDAAGAWVRAQSGLPKPVTYPSISNLKHLNKFNFINYLPKKQKGRECEEIIMGSHIFDRKGEALQRTTSISWKELEFMDEGSIILFFLISLLLHLRSHYSFLFSLRSIPLLLASAIAHCTSLRCATHQSSQLHKTRQ